MEEGGHTKHEHGGQGLGHAVPDGRVVHVAQHPFVHGHIPQPPIVPNCGCIPPVLHMMQCVYIRYVSIMASFIDAHLVKLAVAETREFGKDVEPDMEERVEDEDPAVQGGDGQLEQPLKDACPIELVEWHQAVGNGWLHILLCDDEQDAHQRHQP